MKRTYLATDRSFVDKEGGEAIANNQLSEEVVLGEFIWVRLHGSSWWPAQVVDENTVSGGNRPSNRSAGEVLVRLYGSYKYMHVDPMKFRSEFENILKQHNGSFSEVLKRTLELDLPRVKSGRSKGKVSKSKEKIKVDASQDKRSKRNVVKKCHEVETPISTVGALAKHKVATSMENASKNETSKQHLTSAKVSPRRLVSESTEKVVNKQRKEDRMQKKLKPNPPNCVRISPRRLSTATKPQTVVKDDILLPHKPEAVEKNGHLLSKKAEARSKSTKNGVVREKVTPNISSTATTPVGKSQELSARRMKVMQNLGLIAPSGSPFHQNGHICQKALSL